MENFIKNQIVAFGLKRIRARKAGLNHYSVFAPFVTSFLIDYENAVSTQCMILSNLQVIILLIKDQIPKYVLPAANIRINS